MKTTVKILLLNYTSDSESVNNLMRGNFLPEYLIRAEYKLVKIIEKDYGKDGETITDITILNSIMQLYNDNPESGFRSLSVGDIIKIDGLTYFVDDVGFKRISIKAYC